MLALLGYAMKTGVVHNITWLLGGVIVFFTGSMATAIAASKGSDKNKPTQRVCPVHCSNGVYSLFEAARCGNIKVVRDRLREGASVNQRNEFGQTPLHLAVICGVPKMVKMFLQAGADVLARDKKGRTPIDMATDKGILNICNKALRIRRKELDAFMSLRKGETDVLRDALKEGGNVNAYSEDGRHTLLSAAVDSQNLRAVQLLLAAGAKTNVRLEGKKTPLHMAAGRNNAAIVRALLEAGADPMAQAWNGATPLHDAIWEAAFDSFCALLPAYKDINNWPGGAGNSPVGMAVWRGRTNMVKEMIDHGLDVNAPQFSREPLLIQAVRNNNEPMVKLLLKAGANKKTRDESDRCAADYANSTILQLLL